MKPTRIELKRNHGWIFYYLEKHNLLDKYCQPSQSKNRNINDAIRVFIEIYGDKKPKRNELILNYPWIYNHFLRNKLLDKYCKKSQIS